MTPLLTIPEAAKRLAISERMVRRQIARGLIKVVAVSERIIRIRPEALEGYIASREVSIECRSIATAIAGESGSLWVPVSGTSKRYRRELGAKTPKSSKAASGRRVSMLRLVASQGAR